MLYMVVLWKVVGKGVGGMCYMESAARVMSRQINRRVTVKFLVKYACHGRINHLVAMEWNNLGYVYSMYERVKVKARESIKEEANQVRDWFYFYCLGHLL